MMLTESDVIGAVCQFLEKKHFRVTQRLLEIEKGIDIRATTPDGRMEVAIEAKGETSSMARTARYGKAFSSSQVFDHVAKAVYCAAVYASKSMLSGVAFPMNAAHVRQVDSILPALEKLQIEVFWVRAAGEVEIAGNWNWWKQSKRIGNERRK
jgi:hypothetical protein